MESIVLIGGAGYIGSHTAKYLYGQGYQPVVIDNLSLGHKEAVQWGPLEIGDMTDSEFLRRVFQTYSPTAVIHFAAFAYVGESVTDPAKYYRNNVAGTLVLLDAMREAGIDRLIFSSTCATYGVPQRIPIDESNPQRPINPYGKTKLMVEQILEDYDSAYGLKSVALRYFNAAGADTEAEIGEDHDPETHLIPLVLEAAAGKREHISVFGTDYSTRDGTCVRDYIHVTDLAQAHFLALEYLKEGGASDRFNLGNGLGFTVKEVIETAARITGKSIQVDYAPRRPGDPPELVGSSDKARSVLGWNPQFPSLEVILESAWRWYVKKNSSA